MHSSSFHYFPVTTPFLFALAVLVIMVIVALQISVFSYAYQKLGVDRRYIFLLLALSLLGSYVNIPVAQLPEREVVTAQVVSFFGMQYVIPMVSEVRGTIVAVNLGGAVIPILLSLYLLRKNRMYARGLLGIAIVAVVAHLMATPVRGVGIAVPVFIPPIVATVVALLIGRQVAPPLAYVSGSLGTLIGADIANLGSLQGLGAPVASIGGAGTFDGIFLTGILAALLAPAVRRRPKADTDSPSQEPRGDAGK